MNKITELSSTILKIKEKIEKDNGLNKETALKLADSCYIYGLSFYKAQEDCENLLKTMNFVSNN